MAFIKSKEVISPYTGKEATFYLIYTGENEDNPGKCIKTTYNKQIALKAYEKAELYGDEYEDEPEPQNPAPVPPDNSSGPGEIENEQSIVNDNESTDSSEGSDENTDEINGVCTKALMAYAKTKKNRVKYEPGKEKEAEEKIQELNDKYDNDFRSKGKVIRDATMLKVDLLDEAKRLKLKLSRPKLKVEYRLERFNSTDEEKYGQDGIRTSLDRELQKLLSNAENKNESDDEATENDTEKNDEQNVDKLNAKAKKTKDKKRKNNDAKEKKNKKQLKKVMKGDAKQIAATIGKSLDKEIDDYQNTVLEEYEKFEEQVTKTCRERGEELGAKDVEKFNKVISKSAKKIHEQKQKIIQQVEVKKKALIQKAKLKLGALLGL